jgi:hypothetical protein
VSAAPGNMVPPPVEQEVVRCVVCGGRGGWWGGPLGPDQRVPCKSCAQTGWERHAETVRLLADIVYDD